jgi:hypothetical protein
MEARFRANGADRFNIMPATLLGGLDDLIELLLPESRRRGLFRDEYEATTLRGHLGSRPPTGATLHHTAYPRTSRPGRSTSVA